MEQMNRIGISSACFYPEETLDAIKRCTGLGFRNIEIFMNSFSELEEPYLREIDRHCRHTGTEVTSIHPFTSGFEYMFFFSAYKKRAGDMLELYRRYFHAAARLGARYCVFHGDAVKAPFIGMDNYCEVMAMLMEAARSEGVTLAHENVSTARGGNPAFIRELHERFGKGNIRFVLDIKQAARAGHDPAAMIEAMGQDIVHVHINDFADGECRLPFAGVLALEDILTALAKIGYCGRYMIEVYRHNFTEDSEIPPSAAMLADVLERIGKGGSQ